MNHCHELIKQECVVCTDFNHEFNLSKHSYNRPIQQRAIQTIVVLNTEKKVIISHVTTWHIRLDREKYAKTTIILFGCNKKQNKAIVKDLFSIITIENSELSKQHLTNMRQLTR